MKPLARIRLRLLGRLTLAYGDDPAPIRLSTRKAGAVLAYVAMSPEQTATREQLATLLWGSCSDQQARQSLRQALVLLRKELREPNYLLADTAVVRLQPGLWSVDALEFEELSKSTNAEDLERAGALFGGEFLSGLNIEEEGFDEWVREQRQRMQVAASRLCETYAARPDLVRDGEKAVAAAERLLALDPLREDWQRIALTLYARYRGKNEALARAEAFAELLKRELGVAPEKETRALVERIRADEIAQATPPQPAPVATTAEQPDGPGEGIPVAPPAANAWRRPAMAAALAIVALTGAGAIFLTSRTSVPSQQPASDTVAQSAPNDYWRSPEPRQAASSPMAKGIIPIAVLPFAALGDSSGSTQLVADMMTDDLINILSRVPSFRVISRQTTSRYRNQPVDIATIGSELRVKYVLEGSARLQDGALRVNVQLLDPATRLPVWSGRVDRDGADRYAVRDEVVARIARELHLDMLPIEGERRSADHDADAAAYLGWAAMQVAFSKTSIDDYQKALGHFRQALERDPGHTTALMGIGSYHANLAVQRLDADTKSHFEKAEEILAEVVRRDPGNANAYHHFGVLTQGRPGKLREGLALFEKAIELNPSAAGSHAHIGHVLARLGEAEKAIEHIRYAMRLSPKDSGLAIWTEFLGNAQLELNRYADAIESFQQSATLAPQYPRPWAGLVAAQTLNGNIEGARVPLDRLKALAPNVDPQALIERFGRNKASRLYAGLRLALTPPPDPWQSPRLPSHAAAGAPAGPRLTPILVLPFKTYDASENPVRMLADMMTDDLTNMLSRIRAFRVIARPTARSYQGQDIDVAAVGAELQVRYVLDGSMRMHGEKLRVNVSLIDPSTKLSVWTSQIERDQADRSGVQDEIVARVARELNIEMPRIESERRATDQDSIALTYKGWAAMNAAYSRTSAESFQQAKAHFTQALERDPQNIMAEIGIAAYHANMGAQVLDGDARAHREKAREILRGVIKKSPQNGSAYHFLGLVNGDGDTLEDRLKAFERAVELNPSNAGAHAHIGHALTQLGRPAEGLEHVQYAIRLSPRDPNLAYWLEFRGSAKLRLNRYSEAIEDFARSAEINPGYPRSFAGLASAYALSGNLEEARKHAEKLKTFAPQSSAEAVAERFSRRKEQPLYEGLRLALGLPAQPSSAASPARPDNTPNIAGKGVIALAVLPFTVAGEGGDASRVVADVITDDLINILSRQPALRVISRQSTNSYRGQPVDAASVGAELGVPYVLTGSVEARGTILRLHVELTDTRSRTRAWSADFDRSGSDRHAIQDEIVNGLGRELSLTIVRTENRHASAEPDTHQLVIRGWDAVHSSATRGLDALTQAEALFSEALARDLENPRALTGLGAYHVNMAVQLLAPDPAAHLEKGEAILRRAIERDRNASDAHQFLGVLHIARGEGDRAINWFEKAIALNPSLAPAYAQLGRMLTRAGNPDEGLKHILYAMQLSPREPSMTYWLGFAGAAELERKNYMKAIEYLDRAVALQPKQARNLLVRVAAHALAGDMAEARTQLERVRKMYPHLAGEQLIERFFGGKQAGPKLPQLKEGLRLAMTDPGQSLPLPSRAAAPTSQPRVH